MVSTAFSDRQPDSKDRTSAIPVERFDGAAVGLGDGAADRESQAGAAAALRAAAVKLIEDTLPIVGIEARAAVPNLQSDGATGILRRYFDGSSFRGVLRR